MSTSVVTPSAITEEDNFNRARIAERNARATWRPTLNYTHTATSTESSNSSVIILNFNFIKYTRRIYVAVKTWTVNVIT